MQNNNFLGYSLFKDVESPYLQAWNRSETLLNINEMLGKTYATKYINKFTKFEKSKVLLVLSYKIKYGEEMARRFFFKKIEEGDKLCQLELV